MHRHATGIALFGLVYFDLPLNRFDSKENTWKLYAEFIFPIQSTCISFAKKYSIAYFGYDTCHKFSVVGVHVIQI